MIQGILTGMGHFLQRYRVRESLQRVDPLSYLLRRHQLISRKKYSVPGPSSLWHIDGYHSLIRWGFVMSFMVAWIGFLGLLCICTAPLITRPTLLELFRWDYPFLGTLKGAIGLWRRERGCLQVHDLVSWC